MFFTLNLMLVLIQKYMFKSLVSAHNFQRLRTIILKNSIVVLDMMHPSQQKDLCIFKIAASYVGERMQHCIKFSQIIYVVFTGKKIITHHKVTQVTLRIIHHIMKCLLNNYRAFVSVYSFLLFEWLRRWLQLLSNHPKHIYIILSYIFFIAICSVKIQYL